MAFLGGDLVRAVQGAQYVGNGSFSSDGNTYGGGGAGATSYASTTSIPMSIGGKGANGHILILA